MDKHYKIAKHISYLLDNRFGVLGFRFGIDPLIGLIPGIGDLITLVLSFYIIWIATQMRVPSIVMQRMVSNIVLDFFVGMIPFVGDVGDFFFKANTRNMQLLDEFVSSRPKTATIIE